jgi:hypothetical protein
MVANKKWLDHIWFFRDIESIKGGSDFIAQLAKQLVVRCFIAQERLPVGQLYILRRGFVVKMWRFLGAGKVWGEDMIMQNMHLVDHSQVRGRGRIRVRVRVRDRVRVNRVNPNPNPSPRR